MQWTPQFIQRCHKRSMRKSTALWNGKRQEDSDSNWLLINCFEVFMFYFRTLWTCTSIIIETAFISDKLTSKWNCGNSWLENDIDMITCSAIAAAAALRFIQEFMAHLLSIRTADGTRACGRRQLWNILCARVLSIKFRTIKYFLRFSSFCIVNNWWCILAQSHATSIEYLRSRTNTCPRVWCVCVCAPDCRWTCEIGMCWCKEGNQRRAKVDRQTVGTDVTLSECGFFETLSCFLNRTRHGKLASKRAQTAMSCSAQVDEQRLKKKLET